jgi:hypothetical protein
MEAFKSRRPIKSRRLIELIDLMLANRQQAIFLLDLLGDACIGTRLPVPDRLAAGSTE